MVHFLPLLSLFVACIAVTDAADSCTFTKAEDAIKKKTSCSTIGLKGIQVPAKKTLDLTGLKSGTKVIFQGETTFGYALWEGPLISISGTKITVEGAAGSVLNGDGARWWDGKGGNGGKKKPKFFQVKHLDSSSITGIKIKNSPVHIFSIQSNDLKLINITIDNKDGDTKGGHNTDAFDIGNSKGITIINPRVHNQDDCLAVNSGENIVFTGAECVGGHGISIGSVGGRSNNIVKNVTISHSTIRDSDNGVRVKTVYGASGSVSLVTYSNIQLSNIAKYGVVIQQDYENGKPTGNPTNGIKIDKLTLDHVTGSVGSKAVPVYLLCGKGSCTNWTWKSVSVSGGKAPAKCANIPSGVKWTGVQCPKSASEKKRTSVHRMEVFLNPQRFAAMYNCSVINIDSVPLAERRQVIPGICMLFLFLVYEALYIPCILVFTRYLSRSSYKIMLYLALNDVACLWINGFESAVLGIQGEVYCSSPALIYVTGVAGIGFWYAGTTSAVLLAANRCLDSISPAWHTRFFGGRRTLLWLLVPTGYAITMAATTRPFLFTSYYFTWFFNPYVKYIPDRTLTYINRPYIFHNIVVAVALCVVYIVFVAVTTSKGNCYTAAGPNRSAQRLAFLQVLQISSVNAITCALYVVWQYVNINRDLYVAGEFFWATAHGLPSVIYVAFNRTVRNEIKRLVGRKKTDRLFQTATAARTTHSILII